MKQSNNCISVGIIKKQYRGMFDIREFAIKKAMELKYDIVGEIDHKQFCIPHNKVKLGIKSNTPFKSKYGSEEYYLYSFKTKDFIIDGKN